MPAAKRLQTLSLAYAVLPCLLKLAGGCRFAVPAGGAATPAAPSQARDFLNATLHLTHHRLHAIQRRTLLGATAVAPLAP